jgi:CRISPR-associated protein Csb2
MSSALLISVRLHDGRYHGSGDWPPAPARLFQALVGGAGLSGPLGTEESEALAWLEKRSHPLIGAPAAWRGQRVMFYMPNNDLDAVGGDPRRIATIRTAKKFFRPYLFDPSIPFLYAWPLDATENGRPYSRVICTLAERLYQFGRGIDMAWACAEVLDAPELERILSTYPGRIYRPSEGGDGPALACPQPGSLESLLSRYQAYGKRFKTEGVGMTVFSRPPRPSFQQVTYDSPPSRRVYDLRKPSREAPFALWPQARTSKLVICSRDGAVDRLRRALPARKAEIERALVGRKPDGANEGPTAARVRIVPLPSIGHYHADRAIRRVLVEVPAVCPLRAEDVHWAFSGLELIDLETGEVLDVILTPTADDNMFARHYGVGEHATSQTWRSVTPAALPERVGRHRIETRREGADVTPGRERVSEEARAASAVVLALRHAGVPQRPEIIRIQREPFQGNGERAEAFAPGTRFARSRLWHLEITFAAPLSGPLVIGDGRFLGLGVMAPLPKAQGLHVFAVESGLVGQPDPTEVVRALRRAIMARAQQVLGGTTVLPAFFSGHERDGSPAQSERRPHLAFAFDARSSRLLVVAPHALGQRPPTREEEMALAVLEKALEGFCELRAGSAGRLALRASLVDTETDPLTAASRVWENVTPYHVTRHTKHVSAAEALAMDLRTECRRRGIPEPRAITPLALDGVPGLGLVGTVRLTFATAVAGPLLLGRSRHAGGGLFVGKRGITA